MTTIAASDEQWLARERLLERLGLPWNVPVSDAGTPSSAFRLLNRVNGLRSSATPGARLKLKVTAGNCPW